MIQQKINNTDLIKSISNELGFLSCGISKSGFLDAEADRFENWLKNNYHGKMNYMERNFDKRLDTSKLVEGSKSVISLLYNYFPNISPIYETESIIFFCLVTEAAAILQHELINEAVFFLMISK